MDTFALLATGLAGALQPINLLYALIGVILGTAVGVLPGIGPAMTVALLLPITFTPRPDRRVHHVRRHLLRRHVRRLDHLDPAQHPGRVRLDRHRARGQQDGQGRAAAPGAGHRRDRLLRRRHDRHGRCWPSSRPPVVEASPSCSARPTTSRWRSSPSSPSRRSARAPSSRGLAALGVGLVIGLVGIDAADRAGAASPSASRNCSTASTWSSSPSACSRSARCCTSPPGCGTARSRSIP